MDALSDFQRGILQLFISAVFFVFVGYQIDVGTVYTKFGEMSLGSGASWALLLFESFLAIVSAVQGIAAIRH